MDIELPIPELHPGQCRAFLLPGRFKAVRCGRRWGKTDLAKTIACDDLARGRSVGWFAPDYKISSEAFNELDEILSPIKQASSRVAMVYRTLTGGRLDFWTLGNKRAGRSRKYHRVIVDEAAFTDDDMMDIWTKAIKPTLLDYRGSALVLSNTNGIDPENFFWRICNQPEHGFRVFHAPTHNNPYLPADELAALQANNHPLVYQQEYLAEFVDWSGVAFFALTNMLVNDLPVPEPVKCDTVFAVIDTATKTKNENDGTGVVYFALERHGRTAYPLTILDHELIQIEGAVLERWLPSVASHLELLAKRTGARMGSSGIWIEDQASGMILLQQAKRRGLPAQAIDSKLTSVGKSERAISVSGYVYRGSVKLTENAFNKSYIYKGTTQNHLLSQVIGFRVGDKDQDEDDLLDCFTYGIAIALGNVEGF